MGIKKFKFRLEKVLQFRTIIKKEKLRVLTERNNELREAELKLEMLEQAARENELLTQNGELTIEQVYLAGLYGARLKDQIINQRLVIIQAEQRRDEAMVEYIEAAKDARTLETLKSKRQAEYTEMVYKWEEKILDELAVQKGNTLHGDSDV